MSVWICLAIGIVITVVSLAFMRQLFTFLHTPEDLMTETLQYFGTILAGTTITIFNNFAMTLLRSVGNSRVPLLAMIISAIANVLMDLLFVFPLHEGQTYHCDHNPNSQTDPDRHCQLLTKFFIIATSKRLRNTDSQSSCQPNCETNDQKMYGTGISDCCKCRIANSFSNHHYNF